MLLVLRRFCFIIVRTRSIVICSFPENQGYMIPTRKLRKKKETLKQRQPCPREEPLSILDVQSEILFFCCM